MPKVAIDVETSPGKTIDRVYFEFNTTLFVIFTDGTYFNLMCACDCGDSHLEMNYSYEVARWPPDDERDPFIQLGIVSQAEANAARAILQAKERADCEIHDRALYEKLKARFEPNS